MRYRRLGKTELIVSEVGLEVRDALAAGEDAAAETLRAAMEAGVTVLAWDVSDALPDVEPLVARVAGPDRGRLTLVAALDFLPPPEEIGPQVEAIATRLAGAHAEGYLDVIALPGMPDEQQWAALEEVRRRELARFVAVIGRVGAGLPSPVPSGVDVLLLDGAPPSDHGEGGDAGVGDAGVIVRARPPEAPALLASRVVSCVVTGAGSP